MSVGRKGWFGPNWFGIGSGWSTATPSSIGRWIVIGLFIGLLAVAGGLLHRHPFAASGVTLSAFIAVGWIVRVTYFGNRLSR